MEVDVKQWNRNEASAGHGPFLLTKAGNVPDSKEPIRATDGNFSCRKPGDTGAKSVWRPSLE